MSDDDFLQPYYDPARREAVRKTMVESSLLPDLPFEELSDLQRVQIDNACLVEDLAKPYGGVEAMLDSFDEEFKTAKAYTLEEFRQLLSDLVASNSTKPEQP